MSLLLTIHSVNRWLITLLALALVIRLIIGLAQKLPFDKGKAILASGFGGLMDLQLLLGALFLVMDGLAKTGFPQYRWEHAIPMVLAVIIAHLPSMWKNKDDITRTQYTLVAVVVSMLLVFVGVGPLGGWTRWWHITGLF